MNKQRIYQALAAASLFIGLAIAMVVQSYFLPILFAGVALATLFGALGTFRQGALIKGVLGALWFLGTGICFIVGFWPWILIVMAVCGVISAIGWSSVSYNGKGASYEEKSA